MRAKRMKLALILGIWLGVSTLAADAVHSAGSGATVQAVGPIGMTVSDLPSSLAFYQTVLMFEKVSDAEVHGGPYEHLQGIFGLRMRVARLRLGDETIELTEYLTPTGRPLPVDSRSHDHWFQHIAIIVSDMDRAYERLRAHRVRYASTAPQRIPDWNTAAAGIRAFYFRDPDNHFLEILWFPPGKGDPKWQRGTEKLFLGIDHTAIVVRDTDESLRFYRDALGLRVAGESENYGIEQERLNNVFGARLRITGLRAESGPAIEFLEYLSPRDGRPTPPDTRANDLWHWQIHLITGNVERAYQSLRDRRYPIVSPGVVELPDLVIGFGTGMLLRDPTGHGLILRSP
jgi:catechol 2,3-dioxygenase-like lactoylglutathione lyase family enzyme